MKKTLKMEDKKPQKLDYTPKFTTVYIGNLKYERTDRDIKQLFSEFGKVNKVSIVLDPDTEMSKGIAFVQMPNEKEALEAIKELNGYRFDGRTLKVSIANDRFANIPKDRTFTKEKEVRVKAEKKAKPVAAPKAKKQGLDVLFNYLSSNKKKSSKV